MARRVASCMNLRLSISNMASCDGTAGSNPNARFLQINGQG